MASSKQRVSVCRASGGQDQNGPVNYRLLGIMEARTEIVNGRIEIPLRFILCKAVATFGAREPVFQSKMWPNGLTQFTVDFQAPGIGREQTLVNYSVDGLALSRREDAETSCAGIALVHLDEKFNVEVVDVSVLKYEIFQSRFRSIVRHMADLYADIKRGEEIWSKAIQEVEEMCLLYQLKVEDNILRGTHGPAEIFVQGILSDLRCIVSGASARSNSLRRVVNEIAKELKDNTFTAVRYIEFNNQKKWRRVVKISAKAVLHELVKKLGFVGPVFKSHLISEGVLEAKVKLFNAPTTDPEKKFTLKFMGRGMKTKDDAEEDAALGVITFLEEQIGFEVSDLHYNARVIAEDNVAYMDAVCKRVYSAGAELTAGFTDLFTAISGACELYDNEPLGIYNETISGSEHNIAGQFAVSVKEFKKVCAEDLQDVCLKIQRIEKAEDDK